MSDFFPLQILQHACMVQSDLLLKASLLIPLLGCLIIVSLNWPIVMAHLQSAISEMFMIIHSSYFTL